ncbi:MAG: GntR family transcriptional regulator [Candidatus Omnitrophica bacterium]|nr:GntR family transcriptional regulator [Candidatus Omnitrophota bacterium]
MKNKAKYYFQINTSSGVPIYRQIIDQVKTHIATGRIKPDTFLLSVRQVAGELEINPMTVSKAYSTLEKEGVLGYVRGQGMKVKMKSHARADLKKRERELIPLLREVKVKASQLSLQPKKVIDLLKALWEE